jgi:Kef-type K+ transport system membrane component KefB
MQPDPKSSLSASGLKTTLAYGAMIAATIAAFLWIRSYGAGLTAPEPATEAVFGQGGAKAHVDTLLHVLLALLVVILASRVLGALFRHFQQPAVIGEVIAGILLGPSLLGRLAPSASAYLLPPTVAPYLGILAQVGVILYMFLVGLELDTGLLRKKTHATLAISHASIIAPFLLGATIALWIYPTLSSSDVPFGVFAMFMGVSMSVTAFPVLARILTDRGMHKTKLGVIAISCAAVDDVTAWCLLAFVVSIAQSRIGGAMLTIGLTIGYIAAMFVVVRPIVHRLVLRQEVRQRLTQGATTVVFVGLLLSSLATEYIGIHAVFGAFLLGAVIPHESLLAKSLTNKLEDLVIVLLLPAFFAFTGMRTQIGLVSGATNWLICGLIILVACLGKFGGSTLAARLSGLSLRDSASLGALMNTRGLMELIVLNIGLDLKVLSPTLFAMLVIMALVTTFATTPIVHLLTRGRSLDEPELTAARTS